MCPAAAVKFARDLRQKSFYSPIEAAFQPEAQVNEFQVLTSPGHQYHRSDRRNEHKKLVQNAVEQFGRREHESPECAQLVIERSPGGSARPNRHSKKNIRGGGTRPGSFVCSLQGHVCSGRLAVRTVVAVCAFSWREPTVFPFRLLLRRGGGGGGRAGRRGVAAWRRGVAAWRRGGVAWRGRRS